MLLYVDEDEAKLILALVKREYYVALDAGERKVAENCENLRDQLGEELENEM